MSKKWIDANEINMVHELPNRKLRDIDYEMRKKPNFDKLEINKNNKNKHMKKRRKRMD